MSSTGSKKRKRSPDEELERARAREALLNRPRADSQKRLKQALLRLERITDIARNRPFDSISKELTDMEVRQAKQLKDLESEYETKINLSTEETSLIREKIAEAKHKVEELHEQKMGFDCKVPNKTAACNEYQNSLGQLGGQLTANSVALVKLEEETVKIEAEKSRVQEQTKVLTLALKNANKAADAVTLRALKAQNNARVTQQDLDLLLAKTGAEIEDLNEQLEKLGNSPEELEQALRVAFQEQLDLIIAERKKQFKQENKEGMAELELRYDAKWAEYGVQLQTLEDSNDRLRAKLEGIREEIAAEKAKKGPALRLAEAIKVANAAAEEVKTANARWSKLAAKNKTTLEGLRAARNKKDREYDDLMDLKVALAMEIKAYRGLLENEEDRLGFVSPSKAQRPESN